MTRHQTFRHAAAAALSLGLGSAGAHAADQGGQSSLAGSGALQTIDTTSLTDRPSDGQATVLAVQGVTRAAVPAARDLVVQAHAEGLRPAPVPDQDLDAPGPSRQALAEQDQASVQPSFYSAARQGFSGDGFADGSTLDDDHANRRKPGGGVSLSIPVQ